MLYLSNTSKRMSTGNVIKVNMTVEPARTRREEVVCGSGVYSDEQRGEYLAIPLRVCAASTSSILAYKGEPAKKMQEMVFCHRAF